MLNRAVDREIIAVFEQAFADVAGHFEALFTTLFPGGTGRLSLLDPEKYGRYVDPVQNLDITTIAACHTPVIEGEHIAKAFAKVRALPAMDPPPLPDQSILDQIIAATSQPPA